MIWLVLFLFLVWQIRLWFPVRFPKLKLHASKLSVFYGAPGSGKTTYAAYLARMALLNGYKVFSNVPIVGCYKVEKSDLGRYAINDALLIWDEAGVEFNSRDYASNFSKKSGTLNVLQWFKYHRHENVEVAIFSQGFDDMDKKLRDLNTDMYIVRRGLIPYTIVRKPIKKRPDIDELTHSPVDKYYFVRFASRRIWAPAVWPYFDSFERLGLPEKENWEIWGQAAASTPYTEPVNGLNNLDASTS